MPVHLVRIVHMHYTRDSCQFPARRACGFKSHPRQLLFSFDKCVVLVGVGLFYYALALHPLIHVQYLKVHEAKVCVYFT